MKYTVLKEIPEHDIPGEPVEQTSFITRNFSKGEKPEGPATKPEDFSLVVLDYDVARSAPENSLCVVTIDGWPFYVDHLVDQGAPPIYDEPKVETYVVHDQEDEVEVLRIAMDYETGEVKGFELVYYEYLATKIIKAQEKYSGLKDSDITVDEPETRTTRAYFKDPNRNNLLYAVDVDLVDETVTDVPSSE